MSHLTLQGDNVTYNPIGLAGDSTLALTLVDTGTLGFGVEFLQLSGTTSVGIGVVGGGSVDLHQLADSNNTLTTLTIDGSEAFVLGSPVVTWDGAHRHSRGARFSLVERSRASFRLVLVRRRTTHSKRKGDRIKILLELPLGRADRPPVFCDSELCCRLAFNFGPVLSGPPRHGRMPVRTRAQR
jgi:hypothetical protein